LKAPRFDKLIQRHRYQRQEAAATIQHPEVKSPPKGPQVDPHYYMFAHSPKEARMDKQLFLQGNGHITSFCEVGGKKVSSYMESFRDNSQNRPSPVKVEVDWKTSFAGAAIPDPKIHCKV
jgi:hypothetical protein